MTEMITVPLPKHSFYDALENSVFKNWDDKVRY